MDPINFKPNIDYSFNSSKESSIDNYLLLSQLAEKYMPTWFRPMLEDTDRNEFYRHMIKHQVRDKVVIDLGAGTGPWAMESLINGARFVYLIERNPLLVNYLEKIFDGYPVKIISKSFDDLVEEDFNQGNPEIIVHELFSTNGLNEYVVHAFQKIWSILPNSKIEIFPRYFWLEARIYKRRPLQLPEHELVFLGDKVESFNELITPLKLVTISSTNIPEINDSDPMELLFVDLQSVKKEQKFFIKPINIHGIPGMIHEVFLTFRISSHYDGPYYDTSVSKHNHWGCNCVEFYLSKFNHTTELILELDLTDNSIIEIRTLKGL